ncbi:MAG: AMMECR1 domain-containing protein [Geopsychrobacter sp.]|nr:AMMECR1 domain-containing protein [Geopsychrobacter sp.]
MLLSNESKTILLNIARQAIDARLSDGGHDSRHDQSVYDDPALQQNVGCFVTLKFDEKLRACRGRWNQDQALTTQPLGELLA